MIGQHHHTAQTLCVLGVAGSDEIIQVYGLGPGGSAVTLKGWFGKPAILSVLAGRSPCTIAVDAGTLPDDYLAALRLHGHTVVIMPPVADGKPRPRRTAKDAYSSLVGRKGGAGGLN